MKFKERVAKMIEEKQKMQKKSSIDIESEEVMSYMDDENDLNNDDDMYTKDEDDNLDYKHASSRRKNKKYANEGGPQVGESVTLPDGAQATVKATYPDGSGNGTIDVDANGSNETYGFDEVKTASQKRGLRK
jgi:hypothetical protein